MYWLLCISARFSAGISVMVSSPGASASMPPVICSISASRCSLGTRSKVRQNEYLSLLQKNCEPQMAPMMLLLPFISGGRISAMQGTVVSKGRNQLVISPKNGKFLSCEKVLM